MHTVVLILTIFISYIIAMTLGTRFELEILAGIFIVYILLKKFLPQQSWDTGLTSHHMIDSVLFTGIIMLIVLSTGGTTSPLYFLTYFLLFALALMAEPITSATSAIAIMFALFVHVPETRTFNDILLICSIPFMVPFSLYIGSTHATMKKKKNSRRSEQSMSSAVQTDALLFVSTVVRGHLNSMSSLIENFRGDHELSELKATVRRLEKLIDKFESSY